MNTLYGMLYDIEPSHLSGALRPLFERNVLQASRTRKRCPEDLTARELHECYISARTEAIGAASRISALIHEVPA